MKIMYINMCSKFRFAGIIASGGKSAISSILPEGQIVLQGGRHCDFKLAVTRKSRPCRGTLRVLIKQIAA